MATAKTLALFEELLSVPAAEWTAADIRTVAHNWDDAPSRLKTAVFKAVKVIDKIPTSLQLELVELDPRAARSIGDLLSVEAQDLIFSSADFADDISVLVSKAPVLEHVSEKLWLHLAKVAQRGELKPWLLRKLAKRTDATPRFLKAAGLPGDHGPEPTPRKTSSAVQPGNLRKAKTVKTALINDDDFADPKHVGRVVRKVRRPSI